MNAVVALPTLSARAPVRMARKSAAKPVAARAVRRAPRVPSAPRVVRVTASGAIFQEAPAGRVPRADPHDARRATESDPIPLSCASPLPAGHRRGQGFQAGASSLPLDPPNPRFLSTVTVALPPTAPDSVSPMFSESFRAMRANSRDDPP